MGYAGISGLAKNRNTQTEEKDHCLENILSTDDDKTLVKWLFVLLWHGVMRYKSIVTYIHTYM